MLMPMFAEGEFPTDRSLARMVKETREQPMYGTVQAQRSCILECTVLDNFDTFKSMYI